MYDIPYNFDYVDKIINDGAIEEMALEVDESLSKDEAELFHLCVEKKMSYQELAEYYGSNPVAVKQRVYRMKKKIRALVKKKIMNYL